LGGEKINVSPAWRAGVAVTQQAAAKTLIGTIGARIGYRLPGDFDAALRSVTADVVAESRATIEAAAENAFEALLKNTTISSAMKTLGPAVAGIVPIIGPIIKYAWGVGRLVKASIESEKKAVPNPVDPVVFSPEADEVVFNTNVVATIAETHDWTTIWRPYGLGEETGGPRGSAAFGDEYRFHIIPLNARGPNNLKVVPSDAKSVQIQTQFGGMTEAGGLGVLPGGLDIIMGWQSAGESQLLVKQFGSYFPTALNEASDMWQQLNKPSAVQQFCVHAREIEETWMVYMENLVTWLLANEEVPDDVRDKIWADFVDRLGGKRRRGKGSPYGIEESIPVKAARILRNNQKKSLQDPVFSAYIDESYAALQDPEIKGAWRFARQVLIGSDQVLNVDLDMVPDGAFLRTVRTAQELRRREKGGAITFSQAGAETTPPPIMLGLEYEIPVAPDSAPDESAPKKATGASLLGLGAAAAAGYLILRH